MTISHTVIDWDRTARTGVPEVVLAPSKTSHQLRDIVEAHQARADRTSRSDAARSGCSRGRRRR